jgi:5-hydroxyisourate hydrolase-like protein (transthyretin family)
VRLLCLLLAAPLAGQEPAVIEGRVLRAAAGDTMPASGARVVLHRLGQDVQGPVDSVRTGRDGRFRFDLVRDTAFLYLVSARHHGIEYFSGAITLDQEVRPPAVTIAVADTSSVGTITVAARYLVLGAPDTARRRTAVDLLVLSNSGPTTRVAGESGRPVWSGPLPPGALDHQVSEFGSEISAEAVRFRGDTVDVFAPISPGSRQLLLEHAFPASRTELVVPAGEGAGEVQVVTEEAGAVVRGGGLAQAESQVIDGRPLARWIGPLGPGQDLVVTFPAPGLEERTLVALLVGAMLVLLVLGAWLGMRRRGAH